MSGAIADNIKVPLEQSNVIRANYIKSTGEMEKTLIENLLCGIFSSLANAIKQISIDGMDKKTALKELKAIDEILDKMEVIIDNDDKNISAKIKSAFNEFYDALDNLSCSLDLYLDDEATDALKKIAAKDYSDFEIYES